MDLQQHMRFLTLVCFWQHVTGLDVIPDVFTMNNLAEIVKSEINKAAAEVNMYHNEQSMAHQRQPGSK
jgi:hypothetical protein